MKILAQHTRFALQKDNTTIVGGAGDKAAIASRVEQIREQLKVATSQFDKDKLQERLAKMSGRGGCH